MARRRSVRRVARRTYRRARRAYGRVKRRGMRGTTLRLRHILLTAYAADQVGVIDAGEDVINAVTAGATPSLGTIWRSRIKPKLTSSNLIKTAINTTVTGAIMELAPKKTLTVPDKVPFVGGMKVGF